MDRSSWMDLSSGYGSLAGVVFTIDPAFVPPANDRSVARNARVLYVRDGVRIDYPAVLASLLESRDRERDEIAPSEERIRQVKTKYPDCVGNADRLIAQWEKNAREFIKYRKKMQEMWPGYEIWDGGLVDDATSGGRIDPRNMLIGFMYLSLREENYVLDYLIQEIQPD